MNRSSSLHARLWARFQQQDSESVRNVTCAREAERPLSFSPPSIPSVPKSLSRARVTNRTVSRLVPPSRRSRPRWADLASTLFWLRHRGWPSLDVDGETIVGEASWRSWVSQAGSTALLAVHDRVAASGADTQPTASAMLPICLGLRRADS
jgi:hypothetical protein